MRRRRLHQAVQATGLVGAVAAWSVSGAFIGLGGLGTGVILKLMTRRSDLGRARRFIVRRAEEAFGQRIWKYESVSIRIIPADDDQGWGLRFAHEARFLDFQGRDALHTAHIVAPALNFEGASAESVDAAVRQIETSGSPEHYFRRTLTYGQSKRWQYTGLAEYPEHIRLAFEMAAHEETERIAIEGELAQLEADWREAEEIAAIADNMFLPESITAFIARHRQTGH